MSTEPPEPPNAPVGYKSPPKPTRFKKGQSGNPSGKRKGKPQLTPLEIFANVLAEPIRVTKKGKGMTVSAYEAVVRQTVQAAMKGDPVARKEIFKMSGYLSAKSAEAVDDALDDFEEMVIELDKARPFKPRDTSDG